MHASSVPRNLGVGKHPLDVTFPRVSDIGSRERRRPKSLIGSLELEQPDNKDRPKIPQRRLNIWLLD